MLDDTSFAGLLEPVVPALGTPLLGALPDAPLPMPPRLLERPRRRLGRRWLRFLRLRPR